VSDGVLIERLRQEWVAPKEYWESGNGDGRMFPYGGAVATQTSAGWLLLVWLEKVISGPNAGTIRRVLVRPKELQREYFVPFGTRH